MDSMNTMIKKDNKCGQYAAAVTLNHKETEKHLEGIKKINLFKVNIVEKELSIKKVSGKKLKKVIYWFLLIVLNARK